MPKEQTGKRNHGGMCSPDYTPQNSTFGQRHQLGEQCACCTLTYEAPDAQKMKEYISRGVIGRVATCAMRWCRRLPLLNKDEKLNFKNNDGGDVWEKRPRGSEYQRMAHSQVTLVYIAPVPARGTA